MITSLGSQKYKHKVFIVDDFFSSKDIYNCHSGKRLIFMQNCLVWVICLLISTVLSLLYVVHNLL